MKLLDDGRLIIATGAATMMLELWDDGRDTDARPSWRREEPPDDDCNATFDLSGIPAGLYQYRLTELGSDGVVVNRAEGKLSVRERTRAYPDASWIGDIFARHPDLGIIVITRTDIRGMTADGTRLAVLSKTPSPERQQLWFDLDNIASQRPYDDDGRGFAEPGSHRCYGTDAKSEVVEVKTFPPASHGIHRMECKTCGASWNERRTDG